MKEKKKKKVLPPYMLDKISNHLETAYLFGFTPINTPDQYKNPKNSDLHNAKLSFLTFIIEHNLQKKEVQPYLFAYELPLKKSGKRKNSKNVEMGLEIIGTLQSISDAIAIKTSMAILEDEGYSDVYVDVNSVGDKESFIKFERELVAYYRKNMNTLPANFRQQFKKNIWSILQAEDKKIEEFKENAPKAMNCLSDTSRKHFKEVLEFLEVLEIPYRINPNLVGEKGLCVHTIFEIKSQAKNGKDLVLGCGSRYNNISKEVGWRKDLPALGVELNFPRKKKVSYVQLSRIKKFEFFFIQLGFEAKLRSLNIIDMLRKQKIRLGHALTRDKITAQMSGAERLGVPYILLMGQREALEKNIVVRDMETRSQNNIELNDLASHLKSLKGKTKKQKK